jgi:hypothetical protein
MTCVIPVMWPLQLRRDIMTAFDGLYLDGVIAAFVLFGVTLFATSLWSAHK